MRHARRCMHGEKEWEHIQLGHAMDTIDWLQLVCVSSVDTTPETDATNFFWTRRSRVAGMYVWWYSVYQLICCSWCTL